MSEYTSSPGPTCGTGTRPSRRDVLKRAAAVGLAIPGAAAMLDACARPRPAASPYGRLAGSGGLVVPGSPYPLARQDKPVTWKIFPGNRPIKDGLPVEKNATLLIYNWSSYIWNKVIEGFAKKYNCKFQYQTFENVSEAMAKLQTGQLQADVFFPTKDFIGKLVAAKLIQPLNHSYIPHLASDNWSVFQDPFYDKEWRYTVPYTVYTTGIGYRRDKISDTEMAAKGYNAIWDARYKGHVGILDDYREVIAMAMLRRGITDLNTSDPSLISRAGKDLAELTSLVSVRVDNNGWTGIPTGQYSVHQDWCGAMNAAWENTPKPTMADYRVIGYWYPPNRVGVVANDLMVIPANSPNPVLAHKFLDYLLTYENAMMNFSWNLYQPPQRRITPDVLTHTFGAYDKGYKVPYVLPWMPDAVVREVDFRTGIELLELSPSVDQLYHNAYQRMLAGA